MGRSMSFLVYGVKQPLKYDTSMANHVWKHHLGHPDFDSDDWAYIPRYRNVNDCN